MTSYQVISVCPVCSNNLNFERDYLKLDFEKREKIQNEGSRSEISDFRDDFLQLHFEDQQMSKDFLVHIQTRISTWEFSSKFEVNDRTEIHQVKPRSAGDWFFFTL